MSENQNTPYGTPETLEKLRGRLHVTVQDTEESPYLQIKLDDNPIKMGPLRGTSEIMGLEIEGHYYIFEIEMEDVEVGVYVSYFYIVDVMTKFLDRLDDKRCERVLGPVSKINYIQQEVYVIPYVVAESQEDKFARLCKAVEDLQEELEKIYDGMETPILEITPGGCNFVIGDDIIFDSQSADEVLKGIIDRDWEE